MGRARQALLNLGLNERETDEVRDTKSTNSMLPVRAPFAGTVVARDAVLGAAVEVGTRLFEVANLSSMWLELAVPEEVVSSVARRVWMSRPNLACMRGKCSKGS